MCERAQTPLTAPSLPACGVTDGNLVLSISEARLSIGHELESVVSIGGIDRKWGTVVVLSSG